MWWGLGVMAAQYRGGGAGQGRGWVGNWGTAQGGQDSVEAG